MTKNDGTAEMFISDVKSRGSNALKNMRESEKNPRKISEDMLFKIINDNKDTEYGKKCHFSDVKTVDDFKSKVPFSVYDDYAEYVVREINGEKNLHSSYGVRQYNRSSGTMGNPKKIPMSEISMEYFIDYSALCSLAMAAEKYGTDFLSGKTLSIVEASGISEINGKVYAGISSQAEIYLFNRYRGTFTSPEEATIPNPQTDSRYLHARYGLAEKNVTSFKTTFMTFVLDFFHYVENNWQMLCDDIESGKINSGIRMSDETRKKLEKELKPMPERAAELRKIFSGGFNEPFVKKVWPDLVFISGVSTGTFASYLKKIRERYTGDLDVFCLGVCASEGVYTVPFELNNSYSIPVVTCMYLEFLPIGEEDPTKTKNIDELEVGNTYEIIITTLSGLYRYRTRDAMRVAGYRDKIPMLEYMYRIDMCINLNGEKTYEPALRKAVEDTAKEIGFSFIDFTVNPDTDVTPSCYEFFIEMDRRPKDLDMDKLAASLQKHLCEANPLLIYKFERNLCGPVRCHLLQDETYSLWRDKQVLMGAASTQIKPVKIIMNEVQLRFFKVLTEGE